MAKGYYHTGPRSLAFLHAGRSTKQYWPLQQPNRIFFAPPSTNDIHSYHYAHPHILVSAIPLAKPRIRTKCDDTLPPTSDCVCFMARPWPHLFECWQTYYQHAPAKNDVFVRGWNAFIIYILIKFAMQISHLRVFISYFFANERILSDVSHVSLNNFGVNTTKLPSKSHIHTVPTSYPLQKNINQNSICFPMPDLPHQNTRFLPYCIFLGCTMGSAPKQKREETSMFLVTVLSNVRSEAKLFYLDAHAPTPTTA